MSEIGCLMSHAAIFQLYIFCVYVTAHICAGVLKKKL